MAAGKLLIYILRRDLRVADNPIFHHLASSSDHGFTHVLPIYVFNAQQLEVSGFVKDGEKSPYPPARGKVSNFWRCGSFRAKFLAQSVWDLKYSLESIGSGLLLRPGSIQDVLKHVLKSFEGTSESVGGVWMTEERPHEELVEQNAIAKICNEAKISFKLWQDEKYLIDDRDTGLENDSDLPDVFTLYRKVQEPLREKPRETLPALEKGSLPPLPSTIPAVNHPFVMPDDLEEIESRLLKPLAEVLTNPPARPPQAKSAHPFIGGETYAMERLTHLVKSGGMTNYKETRNGLVGPEFSTKLSAYLAHGCITSRQIHGEMVKFEDGDAEEYMAAPGYGEGENDGTKAVRFELLWRDYMRLCTHKFGKKLFTLAGFRSDVTYDRMWNTPEPELASINQTVTPQEVSEMIERFLRGTTGMGLIDASQREIYHTGYTSNRARQNVASFFSKHLGIDWRYGAEWYEMQLVDYDVHSNWSNWQYVAGVGNDPRGDARIFNPVKQAFDYDKDGNYVRTWVPELAHIDKYENLFQLCTSTPEDLERYGLTNSIMATKPLKRIDFMVDKKPRGGRRPYPRRKGGPGQGNGHGRGFGPTGPPPKGGRGGGEGSSGGSSGNGSSTDQNGSSSGQPKSSGNKGSRNGNQNGTSSGANGNGRQNGRQHGQSHSHNVPVQANGHRGNPANDGWQVVRGGRTDRNRSYAGAAGSGRGYPHVQPNIHYHSSPPTYAYPYSAPPHAPMSYQP